VKLAHLAGPGPSILERLEKIPALSYNECLNAFPEDSKLGFGRECSLLLFVAEAPGQKLSAWRQGFKVRDSEPLKLAVVNREGKSLVTILQFEKDAKYFDTTAFKKLWQTLSSPQAYPVTRWVSEPNLKVFNGLVRQLDELGFGSHEPSIPHMQHLSELISRPSEEMAKYDPFEL